MKSRALSPGRALCWLPARLLFLEEAFNPRNTQMDANAKEFPPNFAKLSECDTSSCRFGFYAALDKKRYEDAGQSKGASCESFLRFVLISVVRGQQNFPKAV
jgi:hypothetical protein